MTVKEIMGCITEIAPLCWQEDYDNAGLQVGDINASTTKALIALDVTEALVNEAIAKKVAEKKAAVVEAAAEETAEEPAAEEAPAEA